MEVGKPSKVPETACLECGHVFNAASAIDVLESIKPTPGDISICVECGHIAVFGDDLYLRPINDEEMLDIAGDPRILAVQLARGLVKGERS
jgi:hypothetical protein